MESPLAKWRKHLGLTQLELAHASGLSSSKLSEIENGFWPLGEALEKFLRNIGEEAIKVIDEHEVFRECRIKELLEKVEPGVPGLV